MAHINAEGGETYKETETAGAGAGNGLELESH